MSETQREKEILKYIENYDVQMRREEMKTRIKHKVLSSADHTVASSDDWFPKSKSAKWSTEEDLADIEALNNMPIHKVHDKVLQKSKLHNSSGHNAISKIVDHETNVKENIDDHILTNFNRSDNLDSTESQKEITDVSQLNNIRLSRSKIVKSIFMPFFEKFVVNSFIKVNIGNSKSPNTYLITKVVGIDRCSRPYTVDNITTDKMLKVISNTNKSGFELVKILYVSNSHLNSDDFQTFKRRIRSGDNNLLRLPTIQEMNQKIKQISSAVHYKLTEAEITQRVNEKRQFQYKPHNRAFLKSNIISQLDAATESNDIEKIQVLTKQLESLEKECEEQVKLQNKRHEGMARVNHRNRMLNQRITPLSTPSAVPNADQIAASDNENALSNSQLNGKISSQKPSSDYESNSSSCNDDPQDITEILENSQRDTHGDATNDYSLKTDSSSSTALNPFRRQYCRPNLVFKKSQASNLHTTDVVNQESPKVEQEIKIQKIVPTNETFYKTDPANNNVNSKSNTNNSVLSDLHDFEVNIDLIDI
ncbi:MAG: RNA polymerase-associated protein rtf1, variant 2 [Marteilia pararefringens]